ncbi:Sterol desaturase/sphingolipid hydroxylase, fatty acid hydroxylase superfamily [Parasphingorhabdus marina DSM 22363]|uniref:Sterol desaturase/sphingolipid hydroxylase, fatty acid hydroxylase superfamily n=1 Tax=Parasphingorhabdus marina DSM 22363 TaxID=1123272 RepID=A0A1N6H9E4_9SPHN|nr:sterol desaturase family protein [Parasphingorhabdus marina]SIO16370.1 Sterol desaturase/sphingolipid hydroxylase, fatty acid hydroxylase superfamily [Parasphingorhabdus marina DSM 22363]
MEFLAPYESAIRLGVFAGMLLIMAVVEAVMPRKQRVQPRGYRWATNLGLVITGTLLLRVTMPMLAIGMALLATQNGWGLLAMITLPLWAEIIMAFLLLDLLIYAQHVVFHKVPIFWRFHKIHHADRDLDVTSGVRFHPVEAVLSMLWKLLCIAAIGPAAIAVFLFEVILNAASLFHHANFRLPARLDSLLRWIIVTPDMHRVHHSVRPAETDSNFSFFLTIWDRLFGTYVEQPKDGHAGMTIGLDEYQSDAPSGLGWSLVEPFRSHSKKPQKTGGHS